MSDLIKREDAIEAIGADIDEIDALDPSAGIKKACIRRAIWKVMGVPSADRPQGEWVYTDNPLRLDDEWACNRCGNISFVRTNFCDRCGAHMKGADDETD